MYDLNNHAQGWIDWNLLVDAKGGPNHLGNKCDASIVLANSNNNNNSNNQKPAKSDRHSEMDESQQEKNEQTFHSQPQYYYFGHFSKFLPPDSVRVESSIVGNFNFEAIDPEVTGNLEVGMYGCERSTRQTWQIKHDGRVKMKTATTYTLDLEKGPHKVDFCMARGMFRRSDENSTRLSISLLCSPLSTTKALLHPNLRHLY